MWRKLEIMKSNSSRTACIFSGKSVRSLERCRTSFATARSFWLNSRKSDPQARSSFLSNVINPSVPYRGEEKASPRAPTSESVDLFHSGEENSPIIGTRGAGLFDDIIHRAENGSVCRRPCATGRRVPPNTAALAAFQSRALSRCAYPASAESGAAVHRLTKIGSNRWAGVPLDAVGRLASTRLRTRC